MRITQTQLRQIILEELSTLREEDDAPDAETPDVDVVIKKAKATLLPVLRKKYDGAIKSRRFSVRDLGDIIESGLNAIVTELNDLARHPNEG